jgi:hypothetical protein
MLGRTGRGVCREGRAVEGERGYGDLGMLSAPEAGLWPGPVFMQF